jgi:hypothetical protein
MKKKSIYSFLSIILIVASLFILYRKYSAAKAKNEKDKIILNIHNKIQEEWVGKSLIYPDSLYQIQDLSISLEQHLGQNKKDFLLVSYLNADCSDCIIELKNWESFLKDKSLEEKIEVVFIAESSNKEKLSYQINDQAKFGDEVFYDAKSKFKNINDLPETKAYQTFLINNSQVIYVGSPVYGSMYRDAIEELVLK